MAKLNKKELEDEFNELGKEEFELRMTPQAAKILDKFDNFPIAHFREWWKKHYAQIDGGTLHKYFIVNDGMNDAPTSE